MIDHYYTGAWNNNNKASQDILIFNTYNVFRLFVCVFM